MVGEANGVKASELSDWVGESGVFDMVFEFSHVDLDGHDASWIKAHDWELSALKDALSASQANTAESGWYPIFFENHDQPRCVNAFFPEGCDTNLAAKCMATVQLGLRGTPFLYEGQELGLTNVAWSSIDDYNDPSSHNQYKSALALGYSEEEALACVHKFSRDNARTPMQWDTTANAGFTTGAKTWLPVHDDYATQNAEVESEQADSVLNYFRAMAALREGNDVLLAGSYEEVAHDHKQERAAPALPELAARVRQGRPVELPVAELRVDFEPQLAHAHHLQRARDVREDPLLGEASLLPQHEKLQFRPGHHSSSFSRA